MSGLIHIYSGDGKGKTTAASGLAVRSAGAGKSVLFVQFLKDGSSSEIKSLDSLDNIDVCYCCTHRGFVKGLSGEDLEITRKEYTQMFNDVCSKVKDNVDLLVLDEIIPACNNNIVDENILVKFLKEKPCDLEVVLTGRQPSEKLLLLADYVTEMKKVKHPYDIGIKAREGIEF